MTIQNTKGTKGPRMDNESLPAHIGLQRYAWFVLAYSVLVVLWGGVVRATGSGAGCGDHWPLCNGVVVPQAPQLHTIIEFTHRLMSGAILVFVLVLLVWTWLATQRRAFARWAAVASMALVLNEALLGALLVLLRLVAQDQSAARGVYLSIHFANTMFLLAALTLTADSLSRPYPRGTTLRRGALLFPALSLGAMVLVGVSGSLAALGDTLYPATSLAGSLQQDFSATSSLLLRLRWVHPASAFLAGIFVLLLLLQTLRKGAPERGRRLALAVLFLLLTQYALGVANILLLAPVWMQIVHLFFADMLWIFLVLLTASFYGPGYQASSTYSITGM
jgi:cytochrome c oxidase assembly protein subunit 15